MGDVRRLLDSNNFDQAASLLRQMQDSRLARETGRSQQLQQQMSIEASMVKAQEEIRQSQLRETTQSLNKLNSERSTLIDQSNLLKTENSELR